MNHASLTARYRPQTFAQAAGQDIIKAILSRAALEDRIAAAYLFSGTRGVGKTTLARVFAKALNCAKAPTAEPCNECESCRKITAGMAVDVLEMDGASNRGIEDAKRLREGVNYAPMEGRYKIFIIDEAHMLSRDAFNALLKTIEEPPPRVTFIMATTEPHKFPATIVSRCQHFVFKRLNNPELETHLTHILNQEGAAFDPEAVSLIARRAAGSVRDGMSLLGQVLALGGEKLTVASVRSTLGLAGEDLFLSLLKAVQHEDSLAALALTRTILDQGVDMGFFLRELSAMWRNLFMLRQAGAAAAAVLDMTPAEAETWLAATDNLALTHIHACWQLTLEGQRRVLTALEPAQGLELLLLNLTVLPRLIPVQAMPNAPLPDVPGKISPEGAATPPVAPRNALSQNKTSAAAEKNSAAPIAPPTAVKSQPMPARGAAPQPESKTKLAPKLKSEPEPDPQTGPAPEEVEDSAPEFTSEQESPAHEPPVWDDAPLPDLPMSESLDQNLSSDTGFSVLNDPTPLPDEPDLTEPAPEQPPDTPAAIAPEVNWEDFARYCKAEHSLDLAGTTLGVVGGNIGAGKANLICSSQLSLDRLTASEILPKIKTALAAFCGQEPDVDFSVSDDRHKTKLELREEARRHPKVLMLQTQLNAGLLDCRDTRK